MADRDVVRIVATRGLRGFADGFASVLLVAHLDALGFSNVETSAVVTATQLGSAAVTLGVGLVADRLAQRSVLLASSGLMLATGLGLAVATGFWPIALIAFVGTLNPSSGDVSLFLPTEQALLARAVAPGRRVASFARYNLAGALLGAAGAAALAIPPAIVASGAATEAAALRGGLVAYGLVGVACAVLYLGLRVGRSPVAREGDRRPLATSRGVVLRLAALFSLDSFGGGLAVQSILALWFFRRFDFSLGDAAPLFFAINVFNAVSQLASAPLSRRIGVVRTMVYTHIPANLFLGATAFAPTAPLAVACLIARSTTSAMDMPARQALVMGVVPVAEQAAAASVTNVPRSLASAFAPLLAGVLIEHAWLGWPLLLGAVIKIVYDLLLLALFRNVAAEGDRA
jgi:MFS family permease